MRLPRLPQHASSVAVLLSLVIISQVAAQQALPKLPGQGGAAATSTTANTGSSTDTKAAAKTSNTASTTKLPGITSASDAPGLTGLPKLAGDNYPPPTVPPTADAPYMQKSNLPEGTIFICVGAALGFIGSMVLAWRGLVAWSLRRSVKRAAMAHTAKYPHGRDPRGGLGKTKGPYHSAAPGSTLSLDPLAASGKSAGASTQSPHNSLFFSPTAGAGMHTPNNRVSGYLPAGYYASGNAAPGGGTGVAHLGGGPTPSSNLAPQNRSYSRVQSRGHSPSPSSSLPPSRGADSVFNGSRLSTQGLAGHGSTSSLNLNAPPQGRAPSAYLEDLFENHPPVQPAPEERRHSKRY